MTTHTDKTAWSTRKGFRPLPSKPDDHDAEDRFGCLDRAIASNNVHLDFATRCRAIVADALKRGVATHSTQQDAYPKEPSKRRTSHPERK